MNSVPFHALRMCSKVSGNYFLIKIYLTFFFLARHRHTNRWHTNRKQKSISTNKLNWLFQLKTNNTINNSWMLGVGEVVHPRLEFLCRNLFHSMRNSSLTTCISIIGSHCRWVCASVKCDEIVSLCLPLSTSRILANKDNNNFSTNEMQ